MTFRDILEGKQTIKSQEKEVFLDELYSMGFDKTQAQDELERLRTCETEEDYIRLNRAGATIALSRKEKKIIWSHYDLWMSK